MLDIAVLVTFLVALVGIGRWAARRVHTAFEFHLAGRTQSRSHRVQWLGSGGRCPLGSSWASQSPSPCCWSPLFRRRRELGKPIEYDFDLDVLYVSHLLPHHQEALAVCKGKPIALIDVQGAQIKPVRVFNL